MRAIFNRLLLLFLLLSIVSPSVFAQCHTPNTLTISFTWDTNANVLLNNDGVPSGPVNTAIANWTSGLSEEFDEPDQGLICNEPSLQGTLFDNTASANLIYTSNLQPCLNSNAGDGIVVQNNIQVIRGCVDLTNATHNADHTLSSVNIYINNQVTATAALTEVVAHELGHTFALADCNYPTCALNSSVMLTIPSLPANQTSTFTVNSTVGQPGPTACDTIALANVAPGYFCQNDPGSGGGGCGNVGGDGPNPVDGGGGGDGCSPIIIDVEGEGFHLTSAITGVTFDISGTGHPVPMGWTDSHYHNAFLALPAPDGLVHNGKELFGNFSPQPQSAHPNGFIALAQYDKPENGGNDDGIIDDRDQVFSQLRLWIDENHDGICQPNELHSLPELGVYSLALNYTESRRKDEWGNQFRYKAQVNPGDRKDPRDQTSSGGPGRWTYDVFFVIK